tara:strand:+ start:218 stop:613 length:396 start_codon:yes stop_codon:yes gene_type:complete
MTPKKTLVNWLSKEIPNMIIDVDKDCKFKVCSHSGPLKCYYETLVHKLWTRGWPLEWKTLHIPLSNKKLIDMWEKDYKNSLFTFILFKEDLEYAWHIPVESIIESPIKESSYVVPTDLAYIVDMKNGNSNS